MMLDGPWIVSHAVIDPTQEETRLGLEMNIPERGGQGQGALAVVDGAVHVARQPAIVAHTDIDPPEP
jgi:hypothetical protein